MEVIRDVLRIGPDQLLKGREGSRGRCVHDRSPGRVPPAAPAPRALPVQSRMTGAGDPPKAHGGLGTRSGAALGDDAVRYTAQCLLDQAPAGVGGNQLERYLAG